MILLVEDNPMDEELTLRTLRKNRPADEVVVARDGAEALDYLLCTGPHADGDPNALPEVVLLDLNLPKVDGLEVLRRMRADGRARRVPVLVLTGSDEARDVLDSYQAGANGHVRKPVDFGELARSLGRLGLHWPPPNPKPPTGR